MAKELIFTCPHCRAQTVLEEKYVGSTGACFHCRKTIEIRPADCQIASVNEPTQATEIDQQRAWLKQAKRKERQGALRRFGLAVLSAALLVTILAGLLSLMYFVIMPRFKIDARGEAVIAEGKSLETIMLALQQYHAEFGSFPPQATVDDSGTPLASWRALLIPYLREAKSFSDYNPEEPWDSNNNALYHSEPCPSFEGDPEGLNASLHRTAFVRIIGPATMTPSREALGVSDARDGSDRTILVVQIKASTFHWLSTEDVALEDVMTGVIELGSENGSGFWYGTADGKVHWHEGAISPSELQSLLERNDGLPLDAPE